jgi:hypothetical protein
MKILIRISPMNMMMRWMKNLTKRSKNLNPRQRASWQVANALRKTTLGSLKSIIEIKIKWGSADSLMIKPKKVVTTLRAMEMKSTK